MIQTREADVIVVGAGPGGSTAAYHLARHGVSVLLLEKSEFPREKVCGDGLTPRAVRQLVKLGIDVSEKAGWLHNKGLRVIGGGVRLELDWPELASFPNYGLVRTRFDFDQMLATAATEAGATLLTGHNVTGPVLDAAGRVVGVTAQVGPDRQPQEFRAPLVLAADGVSARFALALGIALLDIAYKQVLLSSSAKNSQYAFYNADSALECALYYDQKLSAFYYGTTYSGGVKCSNISVTNFAATQDASKRTTIFTVPCAGGGTSADVTIIKTPTGTTNIYATGYNTCDASSPTRIERGLKAKY